MGWKERARQVQRERAEELEALPGYQVVIQKFSVSARERISGLQKMTEVDEEGRPINLKEGDLRDFYRVVLQAGLVEMREMVPDDEGGTAEVIDNISDALVDDLLDDYPDVSEEIVQKILDRNRPLESANGESSETASISSSQEASLPEESSSESQTASGGSRSQK